MRSDAVEKRNPELVPEVIDLASDPLETVVAMARKLDMPESTLHGLLGRIRARYGPLVSEVKEVKTEVLRDLFSQNAHRVLAATSDEKIEKASLRDLAIASGIYTEKTLLLSGLPTERYSVEDSRHIRELMQEAIRVAKMRGWDDIIDVTPKPQVSETTEPSSD